ncbi:hypothetical protein [Treponema phagedenis]|uniref:hypothetical protein n=2 Tax=Treponema phagedenis TaxID=162 RepID=UPI0011E659BA|nr:hypothetical protein [Treponema phagedenis]QEJ94634.1 hypothetical protein FUT79_05065 [Treponema phagedenis]QEJ95170.1 hypothetical protein FUT79_08140 [Treponema phagedenis]QEJ99907.1 hypothetical protein FUT84_01080 [Treponema phagedenis]QEK06606.1 hypothetical protein FUT80_07670 [Treponema phagedenis]QSH93605.1 hypothetical protein C5O78_00770 [Treponema phagedenis]
MIFGESYNLIQQAIASHSENKLNKCVLCDCYQAYALMKTHIDEANKHVNRANMEFDYYWEKVKEMKTNEQKRFLKDVKDNAEIIINELVCVIALIEKSEKQIYGGENE